MLAYIIPFIEVDHIFWKRKKESGFSFYYSTTFFCARAGSWTTRSMRIQQIFLLLNNHDIAVLRVCVVNN